MKYAFQHIAGDEFDQRRQKHGSQIQHEQIVSDRVESDCYAYHPMEVLA